MKSPLLDPSLYRLAGEAEARSDAELLKRFCDESDADAFTALVLRHGSMVLATCRRALADTHTAEDAFQATFLVLARKAGTLEKPGPLGPWLHRVAWRVARRLRQQADRHQPLSAAVEIPSAEPSPTVSSSHAELRTIVDEEITRLPDRYRQAVVLCYLQGLTYVETSNLLGVPCGTVSARLARARDRLRERLIRRGVAPALLSGAWLTEEGVSASVPLVVRTVHASLHGSTVSSSVQTLAQGVLTAMYLSQIKTVVVSVLVAGLIGLGLIGGGRSILQAQEEPTPAFEILVEPHSLSELEQAEQELEALRAQLAAAEARVRDLRHQTALSQIEQGIERLRESTQGTPQAEGVEVFAQAFEQLKQTLGTNPRSEELRLLNQLDRMILEAWFNEFQAPPVDAPQMLGQIHSDGQVLVVDRDNGFVLLSVGSEAKVTVGSVYLSYQSGKRHPDQTAWLEVIEVQPKWSLARITQEFAPRAPISRGDIIQLNRD